MELSDVFIFFEDYKPKEVMKFQNAFLEHFETTEDYFECPKYALETIFETESFEEMLEFVLEKPGRPYTIYLENKLSEKVKQGIIQINNNGSICLALSVEPEEETYCIELLKSHFSNHPIYVSNNMPLPSSKEVLPIE